MTEGAEVASFPLGERLGFTVTTVAPGRARAVIDATAELWNPHGVLHGGVVCTMADTAMGIAAGGVIPADRSPVTVEIQVRFLRPVVEGRVTVDAHVLHAGTGVAQLEAVVHDAHGRHVASASATFAIVASRTAPPGQSAPGAAP